ncbi:hypothetical protein DV737_g1275, partial [Chaetothyriales sp. CBS 132003]
MESTISRVSYYVVKGRAYYYSSKREEYAQIRFDLKANLSSLFTWNTKQVFVYVTANYPSGADGQMSETVIWDHIITAPPTPFAFQSLKAKYWDTQFSKNTRASRSRPKKTSTRDKTAEHYQPGLISLKRQKPKYQITDPSGKLSERANVTLQVGWNVQPWVGALVWDNGYLGSRVGAWEADKSGRSDVFSFPPLKGTKTGAPKEQNKFDRIVDTAGDFGSEPSLNIKTITLEVIATAHCVRFVGTALLAKFAKKHLHKSHTS